MKVQIPESIVEAYSNPTKIGDHIIHEDGKEYVVTEILEREGKAFSNGTLLHITWVNVEPI